MDHLLERQEDQWWIYAHPSWPPISSNNHEMTTATKAAATVPFTEILIERDSQSCWETRRKAVSTTGSLINDSTSHLKQLNRAQLPHQSQLTQRHKKYFWE